MSRRWAVLLLSVSFLVCLACLIYPMYVIRPFRAQGARELAAALQVTRVRPLLTLLAAAAAVAALVFYWRAQPRRWRRAFAVVGALLACGSAALCRVNVYELMFHPNGRPSFGAAAGAKLDNDEKVLAVNAAGQSRAYPIRNIAYHHVINDVVGGQAIVATY